MLVAELLKDMTELVGGLSHGTSTDLSLHGVDIATAMQLTKDMKNVQITNFGNFMTFKITVWEETVDHLVNSATITIFTRS